MISPVSASCLSIFAVIPAYDAPIAKIAADTHRAVFTVVFTWTFCLNSNEHLPYESGRTACPL